MLAAPGPRDSASSLPAGPQTVHPRNSLFASIEWESDARVDSRWGLYNRVTCLCRVAYTSLFRRVKRVRRGAQMWGFTEYGAPHPSPSRWYCRASSPPQALIRSLRVRDSALGPSPAMEPRPRHTLRPRTPLLRQTLPLLPLPLLPRLLLVR